MNSFSNLEKAFIRNLTLTRSEKRRENVHMVNRLEMFPEKNRVCYFISYKGRQERRGREREEIRREVEEGKVPVAIYNIPKDCNIHSVHK